MPKKIINPECICPRCNFSYYEVSFDIDFLPDEEYEIFCPICKKQFFVKRSFENLDYTMWIKED